MADWTITCVDRVRRAALALAAAIALVPVAHAQQKPAAAAPSATADQMADFFSRIGDQIYDDCIYDLSQEQIEVQQALIEAYTQQGATHAQARKLAVKQIRPPKLSANCERIRGLPKAAPPSAPAPPGFDVAAAPIPEKKPQPKPLAKTGPEPKIASDMGATTVVLANKTVLPQWDCAPGVDYVTIKRNGYERKLTGGEICNPFQDVVTEVPAWASEFRLGYTIRTGRLFVIASDARLNGKTIAWAISGREVCRNNPDPDCLAARAVGPLPPGEYTFAAGKENRVNWGPKTKRLVSGIYLQKLYHRDRFTPAQTQAILSRGNIAIHVRLKGEMSEACLGLEPKGWTYVSSLIKDGRATGVNVYIDEPHPQIAEAPPVVTASSFSLTSLFNN